eukprot:m.1487329 g.1487329  ORF g.1487329 m.1487329 type:complete len:233 (+) comp25185_c1_seq17:337-1035(+)
MVLSERVPLTLLTCVVHIKLSYANGYFNNSLLQDTSTLYNNEWTSINLGETGPLPSSGASISSWWHDGDDYTSYGILVYGGAIIGAPADNPSGHDVLQVTDKLLSMVTTKGTEPHWAQVYPAKGQPWPGNRWHHTTSLVQGTNLTTSARLAVKMMLFGGVNSTEYSAPLAGTFLLDVSPVLCWRPLPAGARGAPTSAINTAVVVPTHALVLPDACTSVGSNWSSLSRPPALC